MKIQSVTNIDKSEVLVYCLPKTAKITLSSQLSEFQDDLDRIAKLESFTAEAKKSLLLYGKGGIKRLLLIGLGDAEKIHSDSYRIAGGIAGNYAKKHHIQDIAFIADKENASPFCEGLLLAVYHFDELKNIKKPKKDYIISSITAISDADLSAELKEASSLSQAVNKTRDLCNAPGNHLTPQIFAEKAKEMANNYGLSCTILDEKEMEEEEMFSLLSVSKGSDEEAKLIVLEHKPTELKSDDTIALVGKGLTFDAGGISLKPALNMHEMKRDMSGGGAVFGAMQAIAEMNLPIHVVGIIPSSENLVNGKANKPGDIVKAKNGTTIEILNTDAEGRLILADALTYAERYNPTYVIDAATLTGAMTIALGDVVTGMMGNSQELMDLLKRAGEESHDRVWQLPLYEEYDEQLKSPVADIANIGGKLAGSITAAAFLNYFTKKYKWAHLDIAGTAWSEGKVAYKPKGSSGAAVRLFYQFVKNCLK